jgi:hypothetical protein
MGAEAPLIRHHKHYMPSGFRRCLYTTLCLPNRNFEMQQEG